MRYSACIVAKSIQYTVRGVSERTDTVLRERAAEEGVSLNAVALSLLNAAATGSEGAPQFHDLDALAGSWVSDPAFDRAMEVFEQIDPAMWR